MIQFIQLEIKKLTDKEHKLYNSNSSLSGWDLGIIQEKKATLKKLLSDFKKYQKI
jgi:hypothetical protein